MIPINGSMLELNCVVNTPPAAASADPSAKVKLMTTLVLMPISFAELRLKETARMAVPIFVR